MFPALAEACFAQGVALLEQGSPGTASVLLALAARLAPSNAAYLYHAARAAGALGDRDRAAACCERALLLDGSLAPAHELLMELFLHGENYQVVLERIHRLLAPRTYVEIGVETGDSIRLAGPQTLCIGVDPEPVVARPLAANVRIFAQTSDAFFEQNDVIALLGGLPVDLAFVDGLHHFEAALRDFINLERLCHRDSTILIHDCFPHDRITAQRERLTQGWSGDVWRLVVLLKRHRPDLRIRTLAAPPTGLTVVRRLNPTSTVLADRYEALTAEYSALDYDYLKNDRAGKLNLCANSLEQLKEALAG